MDGAAMSLPPVSPVPESDRSSSPPTLPAVAPPPAIPRDARTGATRQWLGPSARAVLGWAIAAFVSLGGMPISYFLSLPEVTGPLGPDQYGSPWDLAVLLCGLVGAPVTLVALILGIVRASRNHQWRWLAAILSGTVLALVAGDFALALTPEDTHKGGVLLLVAVAFTPLAVGVYGVVSLRRNATGTAARDVR